MFAIGDILKCHLSMKKLHLKNHAKASSIMVSEFIFKNFFLSCCSKDLSLKSLCSQTFDVDWFNRNYNHFFILTIWICKKTKNRTGGKSLALSQGLNLHPGLEETNSDSLIHGIILTGWDAGYCEIDFKWRSPGFYQIRSDLEKCTVLVTGWNSQRNNDKIKPTNHIPQSILYANNLNFLL